jgi:hypothetical protein
LIPSPFSVPHPTREDVIAIFVTALAPYIGPTMAGATARGLCGRFLPASAPLDPKGIAAILDALQPGLHVYVGKEKTPLVLDHIRAAVQTLRGGT